uniref:Gag protein n=1 Tax=Rhipicephalus appendiculatus TaxID=34631 RepID=A0A131YH76_RHIAP
MSQGKPSNAGPSTTPAPTGTPSCLVTTSQKDPPLFAGLRGDDVEDWLQEYELTRVAFYLTGVAKTGFFNHELEFLDWTSFKRQLRQIVANPSIRSDIAKKKLAECVQQNGESYTSYIEDVLTLCRRVNSSMTETDRVRHLLKGIGAAAFNALEVQNSLQYRKSSPRVRAL